MPTIIVCNQATAMAGAWIVQAAIDLRQMAQVEGMGGWMHMRTKRGGGLDVLQNLLNELNRWYKYAAYSGGCQDYITLLLDCIKDTLQKWTLFSP